MQRARTGKLGADDLAGTTVIDHQPGHDRHHALGAAPHAGPGRDRGRGRHPLPARVRERRPADARRARRGQGRDAHRAPTTTASSRAPRAARCSRRCTTCSWAATTSTTTSSRASAFPTSPRAGRRITGRSPGSVEGLEKIDRGAAAREHVPRPRAPHREPRSARPEEAAHAPRARPDPLGPHHLGPRPRVPHGRSRGPVDDEAPRHPRRVARRVRAHDRRRVHAHPGARPEGLDPGARRGRARRGVGSTTSARSSAGSTRPRRSSASCTPSSSARSASASKARRRSSRCSRSCSTPRPTPA